MCNSTNSRLEYKICKSCLLELPTSSFTPSSVIKDGFENKCKKCRAEQRKSHKLVCQTCEKTFKCASKNQKFCSKLCQSEARKSRVTVYCSFCNAKKYIVPSLQKKLNNFYCNQSCRTKHLKIIMKAEGNPNYNRITKNCDGCSTPIKVVPSLVHNHKYTFCSNECYKNNIGRYFSGENNPFYKQSIEVICTGCSTPFKRKPGQINKKVNFCSYECRNKNVSKVYTRNELRLSCKNCGNKVKRYKKLLDDRKYVFCSRKCTASYYGNFSKGENHPNWNPDLTNEERIKGRKYPSYNEWRIAVYEKDKFSCQCCGDNKGGNLVAHHLYNYSEHKSLRTCIRNGITLCSHCHKSFHDTYGYTKNTALQLVFYIYQYRMVKK